MGTELVLDVHAWAEQEFGEAPLGDARRTERLTAMAAALAEHSVGPLPQTFNAWAELKAAYRLLHGKQATFENITRCHFERIRSQCEARGEYLLLEDTTELDFTSHNAMTGRGRIGDNRGLGFLLHSTVAVRVECWREHTPVPNVLGVFGQKVWARPPHVNKGHETKAQRLQRDGRESQKWAAVLAESNGPPVGVQWTSIQDREGDVAETTLRIRAKGGDFIIRANQNRALEYEPLHLFEAAGRAPVLGEFTVELRARPGQAARTARVRVRARQVTLRAPWRPHGKKLAPQTMNVVEVQEVDAPQNAEPLRWVLVTSWPCRTLVECLRVVQAYTLRWLIEEYHKSLKTGVGAEKSQLETAAAYFALLGIHSIVAARLLRLKLLARTAPEAPLDLDAVPAAALAVLQRKFGKPAGSWTNRSTLVAIARLGGFLARRGDGDPGWLTIWRGWQRLVVLVEGFELAAEERCG